MQFSCIRSRVCMGISKCKHSCPSLLILLCETPDPFNGEHMHPQPFLLWVVQMQDTCVHSHCYPVMSKYGARVFTAISVRVCLNAAFMHLQPFLLGATCKRTYLCSPYCVRPLTLSRKSTCIHSCFCAGLMKCSLHASAAISVWGCLNAVCMYLQP